MFFIMVKHFKLYVYYFALSIKLFFKKVRSATPSIQYNKIDLSAVSKDTGNTERSAAYLEVSQRCIKMNTII